MTSLFDMCPSRNSRTIGWNGGDSSRNLRLRGFTLLELMVVLLILALLATIAAPQVMKHLAKAKSETARIQVDALTASVNYFQLDMGRYPSDQEGLKALIERPS